MMFGSWELYRTRPDRSNTAPVCNDFRGGPSRHACSGGWIRWKGAKPRDPFDALEGVKLSWRVVASPQCRVGVHVHD